MPKQTTKPKKKKTEGNGKVEERFCARAICFTLLKPTQKKYCSRECRDGDRTDNATSYLRRRVNGVRRYVHRIEYAKKIGVTIEALDGKIVHHIDEDPQHNAWDNLDGVKDQAEHLRQHDYFRHKRRRPEKFDPDLGF